MKSRDKSKSLLHDHQTNTGLPDILHNSIKGVAILKTETNLSTLNQVSPVEPLEPYDDKTLALSKISPNI